MGVIISGAGIGAGKVLLADLVRRVRGIDVFRFLRRVGGTGDDGNRGFVASTPIVDCSAGFGAEFCGNVGNSAIDFSHAIAADFQTGDGGAPFRHLAIAHLGDVGLDQYHCLCSVRRFTVVVDEFDKCR